MFFLFFFELLRCFNFSEQSQSIRKISISNMQHCGYCLKPSMGAIFRMCPRCNRRAYCSRECQIKDWDDSTSGQRHKLWCGKAYGEEDKDWKVCSVEHGLGVVALSDLPENFPIIIERALASPYDHPGVMELEPRSGTMQDKWELNKLGTQSGKFVLGVRIARVNHCCRANASHYHDEINNLKILISNRPIKRNEEVTISYRDLTDPAKSATLDAHRQILSANWGIVCPPSCPCFDNSFTSLVQRARILDTLITELGKMGDMEKVVKISEELLTLYPRLQAGPLSTIRTYYELHQLCNEHSGKATSYESYNLKYLHAALNLAKQSTGDRSDLTQLLLSAFKV